MATPTQADFLAFIRTTMGIPTSALPDNAQVITDSYNLAIEVVLTDAAAMVPTVYTSMVLNFAGHTLVSLAPDTPPSTYFATLREKFGLLSFSPGLLSASNDDTTGQSWMIPDAFKRATLGELDLLKTPWGRTYMGYAQRFFPMWGIS